MKVNYLITVLTSFFCFFYFSGLVQEKVKLRYKIKCGATEKSNEIIASDENELKRKLVEAVNGMK